MAFLTKHHKVSRVVIEGIVVDMMDSDIITNVLALKDAASLTCPASILLDALGDTPPIVWVYRLVRH